MDPYSKLCEEVKAIGLDVLKAKNGNQAAARRVRKSMQTIKSLAQAVRAELAPKRAR